MFKKYIYSMAAIAIMLTLPACSSVGKKVVNHDYVTDLSGLVLDEGSGGPTVVYVRPNTEVFAAYNSFIIEPVQVNYSDPKMKKIDAKDLARMQHYFRDKVGSELKSAGYSISQQAGAQTMRLSFTLSGIKAPNAAPNVIAVYVPIALSVGEVTVEASFSDSMTNRIDAVAVHRAQGSRVLNASPWSTWSDIEASFNQWAEGIAETIKNEHKKK